VIEGVSETGTLFRIDGKPRRLEFSLTLARVDDDQIDQVGLINSVQELLA
jgi:phage protein U